MGRVDTNAATAAGVTTSWDDGHRCDMRLSERLLQHGIAATFYVPRKSQRPVMKPTDIRRLAEHFEIGAHTLDHVALTELPDDEARYQIVDSKKWVEDVTGKPCRMFCPPLGRFKPRHHRMIREAGFLGYRTVELLSVDGPRDHDGLRVLPTTLQAHPHGRIAYWKNAIKRGSVSAMISAFAYRTGQRWADNVDGWLDRSSRTCGVFHLWGHAWEIEDNRQWDNLDRALAKIATTETAALATNGELAAGLKS